MKTTAPALGGPPTRTLCRGRLTFAVALAILLLVGLLWAHWPSEPLPADAVATLVVIKKAERRLEIHAGPRILKTYPIALGREPLGAKEREGDGRTPEGLYRIDYRKPDSSFHRALHVSYPTSAQTAAARARGDDPGGLIMIHGLRNGLGFLGRAHLALDWTEGCIAVTNAEIREIWNAVPDGTPVRIEP